jgi:polyisoprenoid-binding protein YceI
MKLMIRAAALSLLVFTAAAAQAAEKFTFDQSASKIEFVGSKIVLGSHDGGFEKFAGTVDLVRTDLAKSRVDLNIDLASVFTDNNRVTSHLKAQDFFWVEKYPTATFRSVAVKSGGAEGATHTITGLLNLRGVEQPVTFPANIRVAADTITVTGEFNLNRKLFGIEYNGAADNMIKDDVVVKLNIVAKKGS